MHPVTQMIRCYLEPAKTPKSAKGKGGNNEPREDELQQLELQETERKVGPHWKPWGGPTLVLDVETTTDLRQVARFGVYRLYGHDYFTLMELAQQYNRSVPRDVLDELQQEGIFYNPDTRTDDEIAALQSYANEHGVTLWTMPDFITKVFFKVYSLKSQKWIAKGNAYIPNDLMPLMVVGHNLPFDLGGMAYDAAPSRSMYGGLSLKLRQDFPNIIIKKIGFAKHMYGTNKRFGRINHIFVNTQQLGRALFGASVKSSLAGMADALGIKDEKGQLDYDGPITAEYISYCRMDVNLTWQVYQGLRGLYLKHGFTALNDKGVLARPIHKIYSEASVGKGYYEQLGVKPFLHKNPGFDHANVTAPFMAAMFGGRSEVHCRLDPRRGMQADFKSEYPTDNALMKLQELNIARKIRVIQDKSGNGVSANFLRTVTLDDLQKKETWPKLRGVALIDPSGCILPLRTVYHVQLDQDKDTKAQQIGVNEILSAPPSWYTFADIIASKLLTGRTPKILETITLEPEGVQDGLKPHAFFGDPDYVIDLNNDDLFQRLIDMRSVVKREKKDGWKPKEQGIKLTSNGTSYGVLIEFVVDEKEQRTDMIVYAPGRTIPMRARKVIKSADGDTEISGFKVERPGKWFAPWGPLIPAGGRLFLAIAERLAADRGIEYGFCDTDSMWFDKPDKMDEQEFISKVKEIAGPTGWFQSLNPYSGNDPIFNLEDVNFSLARNEQGDIARNDKGEPLLCNGKDAREKIELPWLLAVSAKRYAIANKHDGDWIMRKASGHGLGHITAPQYKDNVKPPHFAAPYRKRKVNGKEERYYSYGEICKGSNSKLFLDLWREAFRIISKHKEKRIKQDLEEYLDLEMEEILRKLPGLDAHQMVQQSISSRDEWLSQKSMPWRRPFGFYNSIPQPVGSKINTQDISQKEMVTWKDLKDTSFYTQGGKDVELSSLEEYLAKGEGNEGFYRRDNGEFPAEMFDPRYGLKFQTVAEALSGYFTHCEYKSDGKYGFLKRRKLVVLTQELIGKESHDILDNDDDPALDDEDLLNRRIVITRMNTDILHRLGVKEISKALGLSEETIEKNLLQGFPLSDKAMALLRKSIVVDNKGNYKLVPVAPNSTETTRCDKLRKRLEVIRKALSEKGRLASIDQVIGAVSAFIKPGIADIEDQKEIDKIKRYLNYLIPDLLNGGDIPKPLFKIVPAIEKAVSEACGAEKFAANMLQLNNKKAKLKQERKAIANAIDIGPIYGDHPLTGKPILLSPDSEEGKRVIRKVREAAYKGKELTVGEAMDFVMAEKDRRRERDRIRKRNTRFNQVNNPTGDAVYDTLAYSCLSDEDA